MKKYWITVVCLALAGIFVQPAFAQIKDGDFGLSLDGSVTLSTMSYEDESFDTTTVMGGVKASYFPIKYVELAARVSGMYMSSDAVDVGAVYTLFESNFMILPDSKVVPYVGAHVGAGTFWMDENSASSLAYGGQAGLLFFIDEHSSIRVEYRATWTSYDIAGYTVDQLDNQIAFGYMYIF